MGSINWNTTLTFVASVVDQLSLGPITMQVALVTFSDTAVMSFPLNSSRVKPVVQSLIRAARYQGGISVNITQALVKLDSEVLLPSNGARNIAVKVAFIVADGGLRRDNGTVAFATSLKQNGLVILGLGVGLTTEGLGQLKDVVSVPDLLQTVDGFSQLNDTVLNRAVRAICNAS